MRKKGTGDHVARRKKDTGDHVARQKKAHQDK